MARRAASDRQRAARDLVPDAYEQGRQSLSRLAKHLGTNTTAVARIWRDHGLKPHRVKTFKLSNTPTSLRSSRTSSICP